MFRKSTPLLFALFVEVWMMTALTHPASVAAHSDVSDSIVAVTHEIGHHPRRAELYLKRGELYRRQGRWRAAAADYDRAAKLDPTMTAVDLARGRMWREADQPQKARTALDRFLARHPRHAEALVSRARVLAQLKLYTAAVEDFTQAIIHLPTPLPEHYIERAQAQSAQGEGQLEAALSGLDEGIARLSSPVTLQLFAIDLEVKLKQYDAALRRLDSIAAHAQRQERWLVQRGEILRSAGRRDEARRAFTQALTTLESRRSLHRSAKADAALMARLRTALQELDDQANTSNGR
jgi:tetratricopeptide (TPR) repeat protein